MGKRAHKNAPRIYKSSGTIRIEILNEDGNWSASKIYFTPDSNYSVVDGTKRYAIFVPVWKRKKCKKEKCKVSERLYMCPISACADGNEIEFKFKGCTLGKIADAAANNVKVDLKVKLNKRCCKRIKIKKAVSITIPNLPKK